MENLIQAMLQSTATEIADVLDILKDEIDCPEISTWLSDMEDKLERNMYANKHFDGWDTKLDDFKRRTK